MGFVIVCECKDEVERAQQSFYEPILRKRNRIYLTKVSAREDIRVDIMRMCTGKDIVLVVPYTRRANVSNVYKRDLSRRLYVIAGHR